MQRGNLLAQRLLLGGVGQLDVEAGEEYGLQVTRAKSVHEYLLQAAEILLAQVAVHGTGAPRRPAGDHHAEEDETWNGIHGRWETI